MDITKLDIEHELILLLVNCKGYNLWITLQINSYKGVSNK
jgi:hypothetical protein